MRGEGLVDLSVPVDCVVHPYDRNANQPDYHDRRKEKCDLVGPTVLQCEEAHQNHTWDDNDLSCCGNICNYNREVMEYACVSFFNKFLLRWLNYNQCWMFCFYHKRLVSIYIFLIWSLLCSFQQTNWMNFYCSGLLKSNTYFNEITEHICQINNNKQVPTLALFFFLRWLSLS